jgi:hypothetical protein
MPLDAAIRLLNRGVFLTAFQPEQEVRRRNRTPARRRFEERLHCE